MSETFDNSMASVPVETSFIDTLPEDVRSEASLQNFKDVGSLAKSYLSAQKMVGSSVRIPTSDASPEAREEFYNKIGSIEGVVKMPNMENKQEVDAFYNKLGRPETADKYNFSTGDVTLDDATVSSFRTMAHNIGLTNAQADAIVQFELQRNANVLQGEAISRESSVETLKGVFGNDFDNRVSAAKEIVEHFGSKYPDAAKDLIARSGNNPIVIMMAAELGKLYKESGVIQGSRSTSFGMTPEEASQRISEIKSNKSHAYFDDRNPDHHRAVEYVNKLYQNLYPS